MRIEKVRLYEKDWIKCTKFAEESVDSSLAHYRRRGQVNRNKIVQDIVCGKLGEIGTYRMLRRNNLYCKEPDFEIYEGRNKSFDADISWRTYNFHCKSQTEDSASKYGKSWLLQYSGAGYGHTDPLFKHRTKNDFLVPTLVHSDHVEIFGIIPVDSLFSYDMLKLPKLEWFHNSKRAVYFEDLATLPWRERWEFLSRSFE